VRHSHCYERSYLIKRALRYLNFWPSNARGSRRRRVDRHRPYAKPYGPAPKPRHGFIPWQEFGPDQRGTLDHPAMFVSLNALGSGGYQQQSPRRPVLRETGEIDDHYTLSRGPGPRVPDHRRSKCSRYVDVTWIPTGQFYWLNGPPTLAAGLEHHERDDSVRTAILHLMVGFHRPGFIPAGLRGYPSTIAGGDFSDFGMS